MHIDVGYDTDTRQFRISLPGRRGPNAEYTGDLPKFRRLLEGGFDAIRPFTGDHEATMQTLWAALLKMEAMEREGQTKDN